MQHIPFFHSYDPGRKFLTLRGASHIPKEVWEYRDSIEILDVANGSIASLPESFCEFTSLKVLFLSNNPITVLPEVLGQCPRLEMVGAKSCQLHTVPENSLSPTLRWLILTDNKLERLPAALGQLPLLQKLACAGNRLTTLPDEMAALSRLELIRLGANNFGSEPPEWVFKLPALAWYCDSGNPFCAPFLPADSYLSIAKDDIEIGERLGGSPTSEVFQATLRSPSAIHEEQVALKRYRGGLTSDGYAVDDMRAFLAAGKHPNLIEAVGKLETHSGEPDSLILKLVPPTFKTLGLPPDFQSCTRDRFLSGTTHSRAFIVAVIRSVCDALVHLHGRGISHGDLYAHNILSDDSGFSILGDFGAASFYDRSRCTVRESIEVRAFGYLIDDLMTCAAGDEPTQWDDIRELQKLCVLQDGGQLPVMADIQSMLQRMH